MSIYIAAHKPFFFPMDSFYRVLQVGAYDKESKISKFSDDSRDNISYKNSNYCELTAYYWIWKNTTDDIVGLTHYRRYFLPKDNDKLLSSVMLFNEDYVRGILNDFDLILPVKRNYYVETVWNHYKNAHVEQDLVKCREVIERLHPDYIESFDKVFGSRELSLYNMLVTRKNLFDRYCGWLFPILFELESYVDIKEYSIYQKRVFGFIAERLLNVWVEKNCLNVFYAPVLNLDGENLFKKGVGLLKRKAFSSSE